MLVGKNDHTYTRFLEEKREFEAQVDNSTNPPLDSLVDLYQFSESYIPHCPPERYIHGIDLLNALSCYNEMTTVHFSCSQSRNVGLYPLATLLDEGVDINICNASGFTAFEYFARHERQNNRLNEVVRYLFKHTHKLTVAGMHVHPQNLRQYELIRSRDDMRMFVRRQLAVDYDKELRKLDTCRVTNSTTTLRDVLRDEVNLSVNDMLGLRTILTEGTYEVGFPRLWCLIKMKYRQVLTREIWAPMVRDALRMIMRCKLLSEDCVNIITKGLMNYDLGNILIVAFNECLRRYKVERARRRSSMYRSPRKTMPRI